MPSKNDRDMLLDLKGEKLTALQNRFKNITHIIKDEYSMVFQAMLAQIDKRLRQATGLNEFLGGLSIKLVGDPGQLLPFGGSALYAFPTKNNRQAHGPQCYKNSNWP